MFPLPYFPTTSLIFSEAFLDILFLSRLITLWLTPPQTEKLYDIAIGATDILCNINPPFGTGITPLGNFSDTLATTSTPQAMAEDFLLLMNAFRGGNHPFLEKYKAHLRGLQIPGSWSQAQGR
jgi:hypothetical protein